MASRRLSAAMCASLLLSLTLQAQVPAPPGNLTASDHAWDNGTRIDLAWDLSGDDAALQGYFVRRRAVDEQTFTLVDVVPPGTTSLTVGGLSPSRAYLFEVAAATAAGAQSLPAVTPAPLSPTMEWFDGTRFWFLVTLLILCGAVITFIVLARKGAPVKVRRIAGLEAIDDAVGRATEMGRSCLFVPGIGDLNEIQTISALTILSRVGTIAAEYDARIEVPTARALVMTAARDTLQSAFLAAGRPEAYNPDLVYYVSNEQFGFVAHVQGLMVRDRPAACFYAGSFFAESLILAETGNRIGAIQIAATAEPAQLPFFVAACDYTLIGEELFAASAYLSGQPEQLGSLKGQDAGKLLVAACIALGVLGATLASLTGSPLVRSILDFFTETMLT
jgi:hypothetical protein